MNEQLLQLRPRLEQLARTFASTLPSAEHEVSEPIAGAPPRRAGDAPATPPAVNTEFLQAFELRFQQEVLGPQGGLLGLVGANNEQWKQLRTQLQLHARETVLLSMKDMNAARLLLERHPEPEHLARSLCAAAEKAAPPLPLAGVSKRLIVVVPKEQGGAAVAEAARRSIPNLTLTVSDSDSDIIFCHEAELISLTKAAAALIESRPDYAAAARRVLTRLDIPWTSLPLGKERPRAAEPQIAVATAAQVSEPITSPVPEAVTHG